jgi:hypothetical protein
MNVVLEWTKALMNVGNCSSKGWEMRVLLIMKTNSNECKITMRFPLRWDKYCYFPLPEQTKQQGRILGNLGSIHGIDTWNDNGIGF